MTTPSTVYVTSDEKRNQHGVVRMLIRSGVQPIIYDSTLHRIKEGDFIVAPNYFENNSWVSAIRVVRVVRVHPGTGRLDKTIVYDRGVPETTQCLLTCCCLHEYLPFTIDFNAFTSSSSSSPPTQESAYAPILMAREVGEGEGVPLKTSS